MRAKHVLLGVLLGGAGCFAPPLLQVDMEKFTAESLECPRSQTAAYCPAKDPKCKESRVWLAMCRGRDIEYICRMPYGYARCTETDESAKRRERARLETGDSQPRDKEMEDMAAQLRSEAQARDERDAQEEGENAQREAEGLRAANLERARVAAERAKVEEDAIKRGVPLLFVGGGWEVDGAYAIYTGAVKNISQQPVRGLMALTGYYTTDGKFVNGSGAAVEYGVIMPGQTAPFRTITTHNPAMDRAVVVFQLPGKKTVPHAEFRE